MWFEVWWRINGHPLGLNETDAQAGLAAFNLDLENGFGNLVRPDWDAVLLCAERPALDHTPRNGARTLDILHVATARHIGATEFLSFDAEQRNLAEAEELIVMA